MADERRYYFLNRPPGLFCQPDGSIRREAFIPKREYAPGERAVWGFTDYSQPLTSEQIWKYELWPADEGELFAYLNWRDENEV